MTVVVVTPVYTPIEPLAHGLVLLYISQSSTIAPSVGLFSDNIGHPLLSKKLQPLILIALPALKFSKQYRYVPFSFPKLPENVQLDTVTVALFSATSQHKFPVVGKCLLLLKVTPLRTIEASASEEYTYIPLQNP